MLLVMTAKPGDFIKYITELSNSSVSISVLYTRIAVKHWNNAEIICNFPHYKKI